MITLGLDIGSNSIGSAWFDSRTGQLTTGTSIFPAGVDESDDKRGEPKNAKRRMVRRTRITLARRSQRKRELRRKLIETGLLPTDETAYAKLLEETDPWELRRRGLTKPLRPHEFGRVLLHLAQRRGALGLKITTPDEGDDLQNEDGKVKAAICEVRSKMLHRQARTFGEYIAMIRAERVTPITTKDCRPSDVRKGPREYRHPIRNKPGNYEHCADRDMIRDEFAKLWTAQKQLGGKTATLLTDELRLVLDNEAGDAQWRHKGLLFGQRRQSWDLGTLGRCALEPTERCAPHADMNASRFLVVETVNNLRVIEHGREPRPLTSEERRKLKDYLSGPLGMETPRKKRGQTEPLAPRPKTTVTVGDLREAMGWSHRGGKNAAQRFNIEADELRTINTDWFSREIIHGAVTPEKWDAMPVRVKEGLNRAILKFDPDETNDAAKLKNGVMDWAGLDESQADALVAAWQRRPRPDAKRLNLSRRAVRNLLVAMDRQEPWPDPGRPGHMRWLTQIEARKHIAGDADFTDVTTGRPLDEHARRRYATGARGATARDRYYMRKHILRDANGEPIIDENDRPLAEPPPAPLISNPVVRKAIHEVRRHLVAHMTRFGTRPDYVYIELAREAKMGAKEADRLLFRNRLRSRIRNDILREFNLNLLSSTQQRVAVDRVILGIQQGGVCALCGNQVVLTAITPAMAAEGRDCEIAHIIPRASGGHNGLGNIVLAHTRCNQDMRRRTPRQFWNETRPGGFEEGKRWIEGIYGDIKRPKPSEVKNATGSALWQCYFSHRDDLKKIEQFSKDISDIQDMTQRQEAATKYASRQVMAYLADALYDGKGLPERGGERRIYATDGLWTSRFRREWGLFFDPHQVKAKGLGVEQEHERKEKNRGDHRHHAIDAVVIAMSTRDMQLAWEEREKQADRDGINTADESAMENYRRQARNRLRPPAPFQDRDALREAVRCAIFGDGELERPICHRPVKRKLMGALHEETLFGPALDQAGNPTGNYTARKSALSLEPNHLRMPRPETEKEAIDRLAARRQRQKNVDEKTARKWARSIVSTPGYKPAIIDPPPGKSGVVRDRALRRAIRKCLEDQKLDPDSFTTTDIKRLCPADNPANWLLRMPSGVPIKSVVLLRTMTDPVMIDRKRPDYASNRMVHDDNPASQRAYVGGNNHHIEIRVNARGKWSGQIVSGFQAAQRKLARLRAFRQAGIPKPDVFRKLTKAERKKLHPTIAEIERQHPLVDRTDNQEKGGRFVMSLCEGETLCMKHKHTGQVSYFVVAKLDKPRSIVLVPHWDARSATERKDAEGRKVPDSKREQFSITPSDLKDLAPAGHDHAIKVRISPLGDVTILTGD
ncbi:MAG: HNH endonuclease [Phycisphaeraceae bacterium]|nr:HNH endonuclease [Phycisphaeraceae bacterium]